MHYVVQRSYIHPNATNRLHKAGEWMFWDTVRVFECVRMCVNVCVHLYLNWCRDNNSRVQCIEQTSTHTHTHTQSASKLIVREPVSGRPDRKTRPLGVVIVKRSYPVREGGLPLR